MKKKDGRGRHILLDLFWNCVVVVLVMSISYLLFVRGYVDRFLSKPITALVAAPSPTPGPVAAPTPENTTPAQPVAETPAPAATPAPEATPAPPAENAAPTPVTAAATPDAPSQVDLSNIDARSLPLQVKLSRPVEFPIIANGKQAGTASVPPGVPVKVLGVEGNNLVVQCGGVTQRIPASATDVVERIRVLKQYTTNSSSAATPASTPWTPMLKDRHP